jgi:hypothetical protein
MTRVRKQSATATFRPATALAFAFALLAGGSAYAAGNIEGTEAEARFRPHVIPISAQTTSPLLEAVYKGKGLPFSEGRALEGQVDQNHTCVIQAIACNSTVTGTLTDHDCDLDDGTFVDFWEFSGANGQTVTINLTSSAFDAFLFLLDPTPEVVAADDDGGGGSNARIVHTLDSTGSWTIVANNFDPSALGAYTLSLACAGGTGGTPPAAPSNLTAAGLTESSIRLGWKDNSNNEDEFRVEIQPPGGGAFQDIGSVPANSVGADITGLSGETTYSFRVRARNTAGNSAYTNTASATTNGAAGQICTPNASTLCLRNDRFRVEVDWKRPTGETGFGTGVELTPDTGYFWFFNPNNVEMVLKVLNGCPNNSHFWVFAGGLTNVEVTMTVTDTQTGRINQYSNPLSTPFQPIQDTAAFATCP